MNEFQWRRQLRDLRSEVEPPIEVWSAIASRIGSAAATATPPDGFIPDLRTRARFRPAFAVAASLLIALGFALTFSLTAPSSQETALAARPESQQVSEAVSTDLSAQSAELARNPVLAGTDAELRELEEQIQRALAMHPDSARLRRMLSRTASERRRLLQYQSQLG